MGKKTRVQNDRLIALSKGKRIIRSSKHKPQKNKGEKNGDLQSEWDIKIKMKEKKHCSSSPGGTKALSVLQGEDF